MAALSCRVFTLLIEAIKIPPTALKRGGQYQIQWFFPPYAEGQTPWQFPIQDDVTFNINVSFRLPPGSSPINHLLQLSVAERLHSDAAVDIVGVLMMDLNVHVPRDTDKKSRQRATLQLSRCSYVPAVLMRLMVECSLNAVTPLPPPAIMMAQEKEAVSDGYDTSTLLAVNKQLNDDIALLRRALRAAKEEPNHTYPPTTVVAVVAPTPMDAEELMMVRAEMVVVQRGLSAAKEQIKGKAVMEAELRQEIESIATTNRFYIDEVARLEAALRCASNKQGGMHTQTVSELRSAQAHVKDVVEELHKQNAVNQVLKEKCNRVQQESHESGVASKHAEQRAERQLVIAHEANQKLREALQKSVGEIQTLRSYCTDTVSRAERLQVAVEQQHQLLDRRKKKILELRGILAAFQVFSLNTATFPSQ